MTARIAALVPMRHTSERVPGKNYRTFGGRPLYHHILATLLACPPISIVAIDTDSKLIATGAADAFPDVIIVERPAHLTGGHIPTNEVLLHDVTQVQADFYVQTHSTNPLLRPETIAAALDAFLHALPRHDSLFSVTPLHTRLWTGEGRPLNHDPSVLIRTQDLPPVLEENSCLYIFSGEMLKRRGTRIGDNPILFEIPREEAWDIDEELDFEIAESLYRRRATQ